MSEPYRWREHDLDNELLTELTSDEPDEQRIRELVVKGANVNSTSELGGSVLMNALSFMQDGLPLPIIALLVELGADIHYFTDDGDCPLISACRTHKAEVVEFILQKGANPNFVYDYGETPLDWAEFDQWYHERESDGESYHVEAAREVTKMISILKSYGAKNLSELRAANVSGWLQVFGTYDTGLRTHGGEIEIKNVPNVTDGLKEEFEEWRASYWDSWGNLWGEKPEGFDRESNNKWGRRLAKKMKELLPADIKVQFLYINPKDETLYQRNVVWEEIE